MTVERVSIVSVVLSSSYKQQKLQKPSFILSFNISVLTMTNLLTVFMQQALMVAAQKTYVQVC